MEVLLLIYFIFCSGFSNAAIKISELNTDYPDDSVFGEFIELNYIGHANFNNDGIGPSLQNYYLLMIKPMEKSSPEPRIILYANLSDYYFTNNTFFVIGSAKSKPDLLLQVPFVYTKYNVYNGNEQLDDVIEDGNSFPIAAILIKTENIKFVRDVLEIRLGRSVPILNETTISILSTLLEDAVIFGRRTPYSYCQVFDQLLNYSVCHSTPGKLLYVYRDIDIDGNDDYSLNKCNFTNGNCILEAQMKLGIPTPGCPNNCNGSVFLIENYFNLTTHRSIIAPSTSKSKCSAPFKQRAFTKIPLKLIVGLRNNIVTFTKEAGKARETTQVESEIESQEPSTSYKRQCIRNIEADQLPLPSEESNIILETSSNYAVDMSGHSCFMQDALHNENPGSCGTEGDSALLHRLLDLMTPLPDGNPYSSGVETEAELILARGNALFDVDEVNLQETYVCGKHKKMLGKDASFEHLSRKKSGTIFKTCGFPPLPGIKSHGTPTRAQRLFLSKDQSKAVFDLKAKLVPIGTPLCRQHHNVAKELLAQHTVNGKGYCLRPTIQNTLAESPVIQRPSICLKQDESFHVDSDETPDSSQSQTTDRLINIKKYITGIAKEGKVSYMHFTSNFQTLADVTKLRYAVAASSLMKIIFGALAEDAPEELTSLVCKKSHSIWLRGETSKLEKILSAVTECFRTADIPSIRKHCLSLVTPFISYSELQTYLPGLSSYYYKESRYLAKKYGFGSVSKPEVRRIRFDARKVTSFISFITSPHVVSELPFGFATVTYATGEKATIPKMMRMMVNERIVNQYLLFLQERNEYDFALSRSSLLRILDYCTATTRKSIHGLDYITFRGMESISSLVNTIAKYSATLGTDWVSDISMKLKEAKLYLKGDYKLHVKTESRISDHCAKFSLSDPVTPNLQSQCHGHNHDLQCDNCEQLKSTLNEITARMNDMTFPNEQDKAETSYLVEQDTKNILEWRKHQMRAVHQDLARQHVIENLKDHELYVQTDWAMKFLPTSGREDQASWFGKRGIPWHVSFAIAKINGKLHYRTYVHVFDTLTQDSNAVVSIVTDVLKRVKNELSSISVAYIRSDNAGCYHSANTLVSIPIVSEVVGIKVERWDFSEPQFGKGACDRLAALVKRHIRLFVDENHPCTNAREFVQCASSNTGVKGATFVYGKVNIPGAKVAAKIPGISLFSNFLFLPTEIRAWKSYQIGQGETVWVIRQQQQLGAIPYLEAIITYNENEQAFSTLHTSKYWLAFKSSVAAKPKSEDDVTDATAESNEPEVFDQVLFSCPEEGCTKSFIKHGNLLHHLLLGQHTLKPQRMSLRDVAIQSYSAALESVRLTPQLPEIQEALQVFYETDVFDIMEKGWAQKRVRACRQLSAKQRKFLLDKYNEGISRRQKFDASAIANEMRRLAAFSKEEFLTAQQIASFWSREASRRREEPATFYNEENEEAECEDDQEAYFDPALSDPHLEMEHSLVESNCFEQ